MLLQEKDEMWVVPHAILSSDSQTLTLIFQGILPTFSPSGEDEIAHRNMNQIIEASPRSSHFPKLGYLLINPHNWSNRGGRYANATHAVQIKYVRTGKRWNLSCASCDNLFWLSNPDPNVPRDSTHLLPLWWRGSCSQEHGSNQRGLTKKLKLP